MPRTKQPRDTENCPFCGRAVTPNNMETHLSACIVQQEDVSDGTLRKYIVKHVVRNHPKCPICTSKFVTVITKCILDGEQYQSIVDKYSGRHSSPTFTTKDLEVHKAHLNLNLAAVIDRNRRKTQLIAHDKRTTPVQKRELIRAITGAVLERDNKLTSLELMQVSKLNVAKNLYGSIQEAYEHNQDYWNARTHPLPEGQTYPPGEEPPTYPISNDDIRDMEGMFLKYMESVGELQIKILKFYDGVGGAAGKINVNSEVILTIVQNMELAVLQHLSKSVKDAEIRLAITLGVGEIFNKTNEELNNLLAQNNTQAVNPVETAYEEVKNSIFNGMGKTNESASV